MVGVAIVVVVVGRVDVGATVDEVVGGGGVDSGPKTGDVHPSDNKTRTAREPVACHRR